MLRNSLLATTSLLAVFACGPTGTSAADLNTKVRDGASGGSGGSTTEQGGTGGDTTTGTGGDTTTGTGGDTTTGTGGDTTTGAGGDTTAGGSDAGGIGGSAGSGDTEPKGPYSPRSGSFKMLVLTRTAGYRHAGSIDTGKVMLKQIATEQGFELGYADTDVEIDKVVTPEGLKPYEIVFHLNTTGDMLDATQQVTYEEWMKNNGAYAGVHSATDTENGWTFYSEVTGQYYNGHGSQNVPDQLQLEAAAVDFVALKGLPNPWQRNEEWYRFNNHQVWTVKPGFKVLARKAADGQPCMWTREWGNFRAFYTCMGHANVVFQNDANIKKLLTGAIMWAVRREHLIK